MPVVVKGPRALRGSRNPNSEGLTASLNTPRRLLHTLDLPLVFLQPHQRPVTAQQEAPALGQKRNKVWVSLCPEERSWIDGWGA